MAIFKRLALLLTFQYLLVNIYAGSNTSRQLDIPAMKAFFSDHSNDGMEEVEGKYADITAPVKFEAHKGPSSINSEKRQANQFLQNANFVRERDPRFSAGNSAPIDRPKDTGMGHGIGYQRTGGLKEVPSPSIPITQTEDISSTRTYRAHSSKPFKSYETPLINPNRGVAQAYTTGFTNGNKIPIKSMDDEWVPILNPHERLPAVSSSYKPVFKKPIKSIGVPFTAPINNYATSTLYRGTLKNNKVNLVHGVVSNSAHPLGEVGHHGSFKPIHTGINGLGFSASSYRPPSGSLVGQVLLNPQNYVSNIPPRTPPKSNEQVIFTGVDLKSPLSQYELNKVTLTEPSKQYGGLYSGVAHHNHNGLSENNHGIGVHFPTATLPHATHGLAIPPAPISLKKEINKNVFPNKINRAPKGPPLNNPIKNPQFLLNNFDDGFTDDVGSVSSFSYFRQLEMTKGFDEDFNINAGRNIAKQFHQHMFDQTGFPGNKIRKTPAKKADMDRTINTQMERAKMLINNFKLKEELSTYKHGNRM